MVRIVALKKQDKSPKGSSADSLWIIYSSLQPFISYNKGMLTHKDGITTFNIMHR